MKKTRKIILIIYLFLLIYNPPIIRVNCIYILVAVSALYVFILAFKNNKFVCENYSIKIVIIMTSLIVWQIVIAKISGYKVLDAISDYIIILLGYILCSLVLHSYLVNNKISNEEFFKLLVTTALVQVFFTILAYLCPDFQRWFIRRMGEYGYSLSRFSSLSEFRWYGMATQLGYATPVVQIILSLMTLYYGFTKSSKYCIVSFLLLFSAVINSRTAVVLFVIGFIVIVFAIMKKRKAKYLMTNVVIYVFLSMFFLTILLFFMKIHSYRNYIWLVNGILAFVGIDVDTTNVYEIGNYFLNLENYKLPGDYKLLIGTGVYLYKMKEGFFTDIGYVIDIWKYGIPLTLTIYYMLCKSLKIVRRINVFNDPIFSVILLVVFSVSNIKGNIISATPMSALYIIFLIGFPQYEKYKNSYRI